MVVDHLSKWINYSKKLILNGDKMAQYDCGTITLNMAKSGYMFEDISVPQEYKKDTPSVQKEVRITHTGNLEDVLVGGMICIRPPEVERGTSSIEEYRKARKLHNKEMETFHARRKMWERFEGVPQLHHEGRWTEADPAPFTYTTRLGKSNKYLPVSVSDSHMSISDEVIINDHMDLMAQVKFGPGEHRRVSKRYTKHGTRETYEVDKKVLRRAYLNAKNEWQRAVANGDEDIDELYKDYIDAKVKYHEGIDAIRELDEDQLSLFNCRTFSPPRHIDNPEVLHESFEASPNNYLEMAFLNAHEEPLTDWQHYQLCKRAGLPAKLQY